MKYTITESRLRSIIREAVQEIVEAYPQSFHDTMDKVDYLSRAKEYAAKPWYSRAFKKVTGQKPKDPFPEREVDDMARQYVRDYNEQERIGKPVEFSDGTRMHQAMKYDTKTKLPYFSRTFRFPKGPFDGDAYSQQNYDFDEEGNVSKKGPQYPYSEIAVGREPSYDEMGDNADAIQRMYDDSERRISDISAEIKKRKSRK